MRGFALQPRFGYGRSRARSRGGAGGVEAAQWQAVRDLAAVAKASMEERCRN